MTYLSRGQERTVFNDKFSSVFILDHEFRHEHSFSSFRALRSQ